MRRIRSWIAPFAILCISTLSCGDDVATGPVGGGSAQLSLMPFAAPLGPGGVDIASVRVLLERSDGGVALDTTVAFPEDADSVAVDLPVRLRGYAEQLFLTLHMRDEGGLDVFRASPTPVTLTYGAPASVVPALVYVGPGANATAVRLINSDTTLYFGESLAVDAEGEDGSGAPVPEAPVLWRSLDPTVAEFPDFAATVLQVGQQRGVARVVASLYSGGADTLLVEAQPLPTAIAVASGDGQSGDEGSPLVEPFVARVTAVDGLGVEGVWVRFTVASGDGQLSADSVRTDGAGVASVEYVLGSPGTHVVEASVAGVASPATFTASAAALGGRPIAWVNPAGGLWSVAANWSTGTVPAVEDTALVTLDGTYTVTLDVDASVDALVVGGATGTQTLTGTGRALAVTGDATVLGTGMLTLTGGSISGSGALLNQGSSTLRDVTVGLALANEGVLRLRSGAVNAGFTTTASAETRLEAYGAATNTLTFASGWTNAGTLVLSHGGNGGGQTLTVTIPGTLVNDVGATMIVEAGVGNGGRVLNATLDNRGAFDARFGLTINGASAAHLNSGTFELTTGNVTVTQSGTTPSLTSTGTLTIGAARTLTLNGGSLMTGGSTLDGTGTLVLSGVAWDVGPGYTVSGLTVYASGGSLTGQGTLTNQGPSTTLLDTAVGVPIVNQALLRLQGSTAVNAAYTTTFGSQTRLEAWGTSTNTMTFASGWTNFGTLVMSHAGNGGGQTLRVTIPGTLVNAGEALMIVEAGVGNGGRVLTATLDNQGVFDARFGLTINGADANHLNSGFFELTTGNVTVTQTGGQPSFTSSGVIRVGALRTLTVTGGSFWHTISGGLEGSGTIDVTGTSFTSDGIIVPGLQTGTLTLRGDYLPQQTSSLDIQLGGTAEGVEYDRFVITGATDLQGALNVSLTNGFVPQAGQQFLILTYGSGGGLFDSVSLPPPPQGLQWALDYQPTGLVLLLN